MTDQIVCAVTFSTRQEAELARGALEAGGIAATVAADDAGSEIPGLDFSQGVGVFVRESDLEAARDLLEGAEPSA
ncbi:MAG: DUF2007 domain-containing protein [Vicinamibacterales bacterium]